MSARVCVVGAGRSGAVAAACLAELGHHVCAVDVNDGRVAELRTGRAPFHEPGLDDMIQRNLASGRLTFTAAFSEAVPEAEFVILAVPTPPQGNGGADLSYLRAAIGDVAPLLAKSAVIVTRSTVPVGTNSSLCDEIRAAHPVLNVDVVSNPEFLREGHAVDDFMRPDRIVIGAAVEKAAKRVAKLYEKIACPVVLTDLPTAELAKYAANAFLAASVSFINEIANICERTGADVSVVSQALALDHRIGPHAYLYPGIGFGGSCLPKDLQALISTAESHGYTPRMLAAISEVNQLQPASVVRSLREIFTDVSGLSVAVLGLSFKGDTFDLRDSPALSVVRLLAKEGAQLRAFDPLADGSAEDEVGELAELFPDAYSTAEGCQALVIATEHSDFKNLDLERLGRSMASRVLIDGRNVFDPAEAARAGFSYLGVGRGRRGD